MLRNGLGVVAGVLGWLALITAGGLLIRALWPAYADAEPTMSFDIAMKVARLALSSVALVLAALVAVKVARNSRAVALVLGLVLLAAFIPIHYQLWSKFPVWYHLTFLASLIALPLLTYTLVGKSRTNA
jgi:hypothetical protein